MNFHRDKVNKGGQIPPFEHNKSCHSVNFNNEIFKGPYSSLQISPSGLDIDGLAAVQNKQFEDFTYTLYQNLHAIDPKKAEEILFSTTGKHTIPHESPPQEPVLPMTHARKLLDSPLEPSEPSSSDSSSSNTSSLSTKHEWYSSSSESSTSSSFIKVKKRSKDKRSSKKSKKKNKLHPSPPAKEFIPTDTTSWSTIKFKKALSELLAYNWDVRGLTIIDMYKGDELMLFTCLERQKFQMEREKISKLQQNLLDTAKKQNLEQLQYSDDPLERRRCFT